MLIQVTFSDASSRTRNEVSVSEMIVATKTFTRTPGTFAFTLVEVLVVIAIIGVLIACLFPAVQAARESARRSSCANNLRQLSLAISLHEDTHQIFPTGGWGPNWVGDPDKGFGPQQPGGWIYNILPYLEEKAIRELGKGLPSNAKRAAMAQVLQTPLSLFNCPSRRSTKNYPYTGPVPLQNADPPINVAKSDYAINGVISYQKSEVIAAEIQRKRGLSKTVLVAEKAAAQDHYDDGKATGDTLTMYVGDCNDIRRSANGRPVSDTEISVETSFGSAHTTGCNVVMADGSVLFVMFTDQF